MKPATMVFLLLAAACFARSSPRFYARLLANPTFGPLIRAWRETRSIPRRAKHTAIALIVVVGGSSVALFIPVFWVQVGVAAFLLSLIIWLIRVPNADDSKSEGEVR